MTENVTAARDPLADVQLTPEEQARKERLQATARAAESHPANHHALSDTGEVPMSVYGLRWLAEKLRDRAHSEDALSGQIVELTDLKKALEAELKKVKDDLVPLHEDMLALFEERGEKSARHAGSGKLVYINRQVWARLASDPDEDDDRKARRKAEACDALKAAGFDAYVEEGFNTHSLSGYFREQVKARDAAQNPVTDLEGELLPEELRGHIALTEDHKIGVRG